VGPLENPPPARQYVLSQSLVGLAFVGSIAGGVAEVTGQKAG